MKLLCCALWLTLATSLFAAPSDAPPKPIRVGIIGLDTSHAPAFAQILNDTNAAADVAEAAAILMDTDRSWVCWA